MLPSLGICMCLLAYECLFGGCRALLREYLYTYRPRTEVGPVGLSSSCLLFWLELHAAEWQPLFASEM